MLAQGEYRRSGQPAPAIRAIARGLLLVLAIGLGACSTRSLAGLETAADGPAVQQAVADCEARYQGGALNSYRLVAECERAVALPEEQREGPYLTGLYEVLWRNKIELYDKIDAGRLTKPEADQQQAIDARNIVGIVRDIRRL
jgi:hypothetical protein